MYTELLGHKDNLSHAYVLSGDVEHTRKDLEQFLIDDLGIEIVANPNYFDRLYDRLGIDEVRRLGELQSKTAVGNGNKIFVVGFNTITVEAQNAMLKMVEEPTPGTIWFFLLPDYHVLLPTILSRVQLINTGGGERYKELAIQFLSSSYIEREKIFGQFVGDSKKNIASDRTGAGEFITALLSLILEQKGDGFTATYRDLEKMRGYVTDRSSSVKYIIEYISIRLPLEQ